jgi:hypothetical protein
MTSSSGDGVRDGVAWALPTVDATSAKRRRKGNRPREEGIRFPV